MPHPGRNLGLGQQSDSAARARLGRIAGPFHLGRPMEIDGCASISREQNRGRVL